MELERVKKYLEKASDEDEDDNNNINASTITQLPIRFFEHLIIQGLHVDLIEPGRLICSIKAPPRLLNSGNFLHGGATAAIVDIVGGAALYTYGVPHSGVSVEINISYVDAACIDDEIEIEASVLHFDKVIAVVSVELRKKKTGQIIARGRHTKYLVVASKM